MGDGMGREGEDGDGWGTGGEGEKGGRGQGGVGQERVEEGTGRRRGRVPSLLGGPHSSPTPRLRVTHSPTDQKGFKKPGGLQGASHRTSCGRLPPPPRLSRGPCAHTAPGARYLAAAPTKWACARAPLALP